MTRFWQFGLGLAVSGVVAASANGALVISEVVYNEVGSANSGEWIEIYNNGASSIDLSNFKIGDEETSGSTSTTEAMFQFPAGASIGASEVQIVAFDADAFFTLYGFLPTYETNGTTNGTVPNMTIYSTWDPDGLTLTMSNSNDQAVILDGSDAFVDAVNWGNTFALNPGLNADGEADGQSYERINANVDTDTAADWQLGPTSDTASERSTPGVVTIPEPTATAGLLLAGMLGFTRRRR